MKKTTEKWKRFNQKWKNIWKKKNAGVGKIRKQKSKFMNIKKVKSNMSAISVCKIIHPKGELRRKQKKIQMRNKQTINWQNNATHRGNIHKVYIFETQESVMSKLVNRF